MERTTQQLINNIYLETKHWTPSTWKTFRSKYGYKVEDVEKRLEEIIELKYGGEEEV